MNAQDERALARTVIELLRLAASRWATGRLDTAEKLTRAAWALVGTDAEFIDPEVTK